MAVTGDPVRQFVIDHLKERLGTVTVANGYHTNIGFNVIAEEDQAPQSADPIPCVILDEGVELPDDEDGAGAYDRAVQISIQGVDKYSEGAPKSHARLMLADIQKLLGTDENLYFTAPTDLGDKSLKLRVTEAANLLNGGGLLKGRVYCEANYQVTYITSRKDPHIGKPT